MDGTRDWPEQTGGLKLSPDHLDLLRAVGELQEPNRYPGTQAAGRRLLELWKARGGPYVWQGSAPWHGTSPYAAELRTAGLLEVHSGIARFRRWGRPAEVVQQYWLELTDAGRRMLADAWNGDANAG